MWYNTHDSQRLEGGLLMKTKSLVNAAMMMAIYLVFLFYIMSEFYQVS